MLTEKSGSLKLGSEHVLIGVEILIDLVSNKVASLLGLKENTSMKSILLSVLKFVILVVAVGARLGSSSIHEALPKAFLKRVPFCDVSLIN